MTGLRSGADDADIDLTRIFGAIWEKKGPVLLAMIVAGLAAFAVTRAMHPLYHAQATLLIQPRDGIAGSGSGNNSADQAILDDSGVTSQVQVLKSTGMAQDVIEKFKLAERSEFGASGKPSLAGRLLARLGIGGGASDAPSQQAVLDTFEDKLNVYKVASSRVIVVEFSSQDPKLAAEVPNALVKDYLLRQSGLKLSDDSQAAAWLKPEIERLRSKVDAAESKVAEYRAKSDLYSVGNNDTLADRELGDTVSELSKVRSERIDAEARAASVRAALKSGRGVDTLANIVGSPLIQQLRQQEVSAQAQLADLSTTLGSRHPRIRALKSQVAELGSRIKAESRKVLDSLESEAGIAKMREQDLTSQLERLKQNAGRAGEQSVKLQALQREAAADRDLLNQYLARYRQASSRTSLSALPADARIISNAVVPAKPYFPKTVPIVIVAMLATFLIAAIAIMLSELFSGRALRPVVVGGETGEREPHPLLQPLAEGMTSMAAIGVLARRVEHRKEGSDKGDKTEAGNAETVDETSQPSERSQDEPSLAEPATEQRDARDGDEAGGAPAAAEETEPQPSEAALRAMAAADAASHNEADVPESAYEDYGAFGEPDDAPLAREPDFSIAAAAAHLIGKNGSVVICVSPEGDRASAATVILARLLAEQGAHTVLVDLTATGYPSRMMVQYKQLPGITNLLTGDVNFADSLHGDRISPAHILPCGTADPEQARRAADRLPIILDGLGDVYAFVLVECGARDLAEIARLSRKDEHRDILVTALQPSHPGVVEAISELYGSGHDDIIVMVAGGAAGDLETDETRERSAGR